MDPNPWRRARLIASIALALAILGGFLGMMIYAFGVYEVFKVIAFSIGVPLAVSVLFFPLYAFCKWWQDKEAEWDVRSARTTGDNKP